MVNKEVVVVPIPIKPSLLTKRSEEVAELILKAGVTPLAFETLTDKTAEGEEEAMPTLPFPSIVNLVLVPSAVEEAILNFQLSLLSRPIVQEEPAESVIKPTAGLSFVPVETTVRFSDGLVVPIPTLPSLLTKNNEDVAELILKAGVTPVAFETLTERTAEGEVEAMPT